MTNTEKPTTKAESKKQGIVEAPKKKMIQAPVQKKNVAEAKASEDKVTDKLKQETSDSINKISQSSDSEQTKPKEPKKPVQKKPKVRKTEVEVNAMNLPISTKYSKAICKFIKNKKIKKAIADLEQVILKKKAVPMKGEIPHRKGKKIMSGRYPKKATEHFINLLKSLQGNANNHEVENPTIIRAIANIGSRPYGKFGRIRRKRTHVTIAAKQIKKIKKEKKK